MKRKRSNLLLLLPACLIGLGSCSKSEQMDISVDPTLQKGPKSETFKVYFDQKDSTEIKQAFKDNMGNFRNKYKDYNFLVINGDSKKKLASSSLKSTTVSSQSDNSSGYYPHEVSNEGYTPVTFQSGFGDFHSENDDTFDYGLSDPQMIYFDPDITKYFNGDFNTDYDGNQYTDAYGNPFYQDGNWMWGNRFPDPYNTFIAGEFYSAPLFRTGIIYSSADFTKRNMSIHVNIPYRYAAQFTKNYQYRFKYANDKRIIESNPRSIMYFASNEGTGEIEDDNIMAMCEVNSDGQFYFRYYGLREKRIEIRCSNGRMMMSAGVDLSAFKIGNEIEAGVTITKSSYSYNHYSAQGNGKLCETNSYDRPTYEMSWTGYSVGPQI